MSSKCPGYYLISYILFYIFREDTIRKTLEVGGNVLMPVDTAGRVLELILILEEVLFDSWNDAYANFYL